MGFINTQRDDANFRWIGLNFKEEGGWMWLHDPDIHGYSSGHNSSSSQEDLNTIKMASEVTYADINVSLEEREPVTSRSLDPGNEITYATVKVSWKRDSTLKTPPPVYSSRDSLWLYAATVLGIIALILLVIAIALSVRCLSCDSPEIISDNKSTRRSSRSPVSSCCKRSFRNFSRGSKYPSETHCFFSLLFRPEKEGFVQGVNNAEEDHSLFCLAGFADGCSDSSTRGIWGLSV
ncbi:hypothetical protein Y1Q_0016796 [Alligator mississippiensis]|uniref:Uncharacterized protein n=1 Tax=Alligator mississippiensis TaxID=8496 RepID=A0A151P6J5_ALLMI|nr:hypothetical protein Y1Q_0016796 [Alligator mississippiensis]